MKATRFLTLILCLILLGACLFACNGKDSDPVDKKFFFNTLKLDENNLTGEVANEITAFSFLDEIETIGKAKSEQSDREIHDCDRAE